MIQATRKLYDEDAYSAAFTGTVQACSEIEDGPFQGKYKVYLDQTLFFPEEGGQTPDKGQLADMEVLDVQIEKRDGTECIYHVTDKSVVAGTEVHGEIDWTHRFDNMQQHSGEHVFSGTVHREFGYDNVGFHLSDQVVTMDFNGMLTDAQVKMVEEKVNAVIFSNVPILISWPDDTALAALEYRSKKELEGPVRIVTIPGTDVCACCAPHVKQTGEIGFLKVLNRQNYKGGVRITIECGMRALKTMTGEHSLLQDLANSMTTSIDKVPGQLQRLRDDNAQLRGDLSKARMELLSYRLKEIPAEQKNVVLLAEDMDNKSMQSTVNALVQEHSGYCGIFLQSGGDFRFLLGSGDGDAREALTVLKDKFGAKGGGSAQMVQGSVSGASFEEMQAALLAL